MKLSAVLLLALLAVLMVSAVSGRPMEAPEIDDDIGEVENDMDGDMRTTTTTPPTTTTMVSQLKIGTLFPRCQLRSVTRPISPHRNYE